MATGLQDLSNALRTKVQGNNYVYGKFGEMHAIVTHDIIETAKAQYFAAGSFYERIPVKSYEAQSNVNQIISWQEQTISSIDRLETFYGYGDGNSEFIDFIPRFCPKMYSANQQMIDFSQKVPNGKYGFTIWHDAKFTITGGIKINWTLDNSETLVDFANSLTEDDLIVDEYVMYTNKSDGTEQELLSRWGNTKTTGNVYTYDMFTPFHYEYYAGRHLGYTAYLHSALFPRSSLSNNPNFFWGIYGQDRNPNLNYVALSYIGETTPCAWLIYAKKSEWARFFNSSGMPWAWDEIAVKSPDTGGLNMPTYPGQPENPTDDTPGDGDNLSDVIEYPVVKYIPTPYSRYWLQPSKLQSLRDFLFSETFLNNIARIWENPGENIIDIAYYPIDSAALSLAADTAKIVIGNIGSDVTALTFSNSAPNYFFAGEYTVTPYYNSYLDYEPYTSVSIYLPYIGIKPLNASKITGHKLSVAYSFDFGNRLITAHIGVDGNMTLSGGNVGNFVDEFTAGFGVAFPMSGTGNNQIAMNVLNAVGTVATSAASIAGGVATGSVKSIVGGVEKLGGVLGDKIHGENYGSLSPTTGLYSPQCPYLIINRPITAEPSEYKNMYGYSAAYSAKISTFSGFLQCGDVRLKSDGTMTEREQQLIIDTLQGGIYI